MKRFYLTGHRSFGNRGCEAIVRSTADLLKSRFGEVELIVPSENIALDSAQWPDAEASGVTFVPVYTPIAFRFWIQAQRLPVRALKKTPWPFPMPSYVKDLVSSADCVLSIGGDMYTYEGRLPSWIMAHDQLAMNLGKPVVLWGATVGTFEQEPLFAPSLYAHLQRMSLIAVRESISANLLTQTFGLSNVIRMPDTAFSLQPEPVAIDRFWPRHDSNGVLGLNVSPLIARLSASGRKIQRATERFIRLVTSEFNLSVLLVPHVTPLDGSTKNSDTHFMRAILECLPDIGDRVSIMDSSLNAAQTKYVIGKCRYFIGARTHATIASLSNAVPTVSLAYSTKARGINRDFLGNEGNVLDMNSITETSLVGALRGLVDRESEIRSILASATASPAARAATVSALDALDAVINRTQN